MKRETAASKRDKSINDPVNKRNLWREKRVAFEGVRNAYAMKCLSHERPGALKSNRPL
jgi:hypothetical protein